MAAIQQADLLLDKIVDIIQANPGIDSPRLGQLTGMAAGDAATRLTRIFRHPRFQRKLARESFQTPQKRTAFRWYTIDKVPEGIEVEVYPPMDKSNGIPLPQAAVAEPEPVVDVQPEPEIVTEVEPVTEVQPELEAEPVIDAQPEPEIVNEVEPELEPAPQTEPEPVMQAAVPDLSRFVGTPCTNTAIVEFVQAFPGKSAAEIGKMSGWGQNKASARLVSIYQAKNKRLDRIEAPGRDGRIAYRWYTPDNLPEDVKQRRAEAAAAFEKMVEEKRQREERQRIRQEARERRAAERAAEEEKQLELTPDEVQEPEENLEADQELTENSDSTTTEVIEQPTSSMALVSEGMHALDEMTPARQMIGDALVGFAEQAAQILARAFAPIFEQAVARQLQKTLQDLPAKIAPSIEQAITPQVATPTPKKVKKPKIVVVGLLPHQANIIHEEWNEHFDLDFFPNDCNPGRLQEKLAYADHCYLMTTKINHAHQAVVKKSKRPFTYLNGIMTSLRDNLRAALATLPKA